jgi:hypothetical protein
VGWSPHHLHNQPARSAPPSRAALGAQVHVLVQLEPGDLDRLAADPHLWLTFWGVVVPFALTVPEPA